MNHIYKVIWNKAKHCYTVVSEIAKSHSDSTKRVRVGTTATLMAVAVLTGFAMPAQAAVSIGTDGTVKAEAADINALNNLLKNGVTTNKDGSVTVGGLTVKKNGEVSVNSPDVVYGKNAKIIWDSNNTMGQISIGNNATAITGHGGQERAFAYDGDVNHAAGAIAIGANTYARTGSIMIGSHVYKGNMGDVTGIDTDSFNTDSNGAYGFTVNSTTIGTNSFTRGNLATTIGDYNIQSGKSSGYGWNSLLYGAQNFGATVIGALNSNESQSAGSGMSGIANSIVGVANKVNSSNGTLVFGAGNEVTNSLTAIYGVDDTTSLRDATAAQNALKNAVAESDAGGAVLAIGGANKADWARKSQLIGVGNTLTGASSAVSEYNMINGYKNEVTNATHTSIIGSNNKAKNIKSTIVMGDHNTLEDRENVISLGNNNTVDANNAVAIGNGTTVSVESGVAIGVGSVADRVAESEKGARGEFAPDTIPTGQESTWTSTKGAVSVGDTANNITRQITNVAAGREDTDAVNVAQLKKVNEEAGKHSVVTEGANITVTPEQAEDGRMQYNVALNNNIRLSGDNDAFVNISGSNGSVWASSSVAAGNVIMDGTTATVSGLGNTTTAYDGFANGEGKAATEEQLKEVSKVAENANQGWNLSTNGGEASKVAPGETVDISGDKNIKISNDGTNVKVKLNDNIDVNSVQTNALNAKYNLSVGTANENGTVPFFVNSNGAFYAANGKLVVDKDGKVTATEGEIGNVVLKNGVLYKNTALRDGELYVGDADGNYSQITPKSAKLGQVTIDEKGNIAGANSIQTNALNAKYNLSVGTANENGTVPFFVNSNGAFYAANGKLVVDKDGKVTATEGEIGNVVLKNGVLYKNTALRDGELYVGDVDGNYSQITTKGAKLGKVTVAVDGKISGVAAGAITADSTDAVNGSQLHAVATEAGKHSKVVSGNNINVEETDVDGQKFYKVNMNKDIMLGDLTGKNVSISGTNGTIEATGAIATKDRVYADKGAKLADIDVTGDTISNGDAKLALNGAAGTAGMINGKGASVYMQDGYTVINSKVAFDQNGKISGVAAGAVTADSTDAVNGSQLHAVATEAGKHSKVVSGNNINVEETDVDGQKFYKVNMNKDIMLGDLTGKNVSISGTNGTIETTGFIATKDKIYADKGAKLADVNVTGDTISNDKSSVKLDKEGTVTINNRVTIDQSGKISGVAAGEISSTSTDAVNGSQLHAVQQEAGKHTKVVNGSNITVEETDQDGQKTYKVGLNKDLLLGDITGKNVSISGTNGTIETTGFIATKDKIYADKGAKLADVNVTGDTISNDKSSVKLDKEGTVTINNRVTIDQSGKISGVAAGEISSTSTDAVNGSQLKATNDRVSQVEGNITEIKGDITNIKSDITNIKGDVKNLGDRVTKVEQEAGKHTKVVNGSNVTVEETDQDGQKTYKVGLNKDLLLGDITGKNVSISGTNGTIETTGSIATKDKIYADKGAKLADIDITGDTISNGQSSVKLDKEGTVTINGKVSVNQDGKVSGVAAGDISEKSTDAVNGSQLFATNQQVAQNVQSISKLGNRINKVGAGAAALAALHPLDFDPDDKWDIAAGYGNYNGENAAAIGAYYRPNEDTMFSVGGSFGNGENMVNAGVSLKLGQGNHVSTSKVAMAKEIKDLRKELEGLKSALLDVNAGKKLDTSKLQLFPDVPKNHWAYEYVSTLKGNGVLTGYPDGEFKGDRPMTRYEFATMLYKAMLEGATLSDKILKEFAPELERFTVDTVHQDKDGKPTVERVRTVKAEK